MLLNKGFKMNSSIGFYKTNQVIKVAIKGGSLTMPIGTSIQVKSELGDQIQIKSTYYNKWVNKSFLSKLNKSI